MTALAFDARDRTFVACGMRRLALALVPITSMLALYACSSSGSDGGAVDAGAQGDAAAPPSDAAATADASPLDTGAAPDAGAIDVGPCDGVTGTCVAFVAGMSTEAPIAEAFVTASGNTTLAFGPGTFAFVSNMLTLATSHVTVKGAGIDQTILDFKGELVAGDGIFASNLTNVTFQDFSVRDARGNAIKVLTATSVTFERVKASWTSTQSASHGPYGLYPVASRDVLIDACVVEGASDSGIYVGQSKNIIVRKNTVKRNVAGIEIENSFDADVFDNDAEDNSAGILVFDLPNLPQLGGHGVRVFHNTIKRNNTPNFAARGDIVSIVPAGTGCIVMANHDVEIFNNQVEANMTGGCAVISFFITQMMITDPNYYPFPARVHLHDNMFVGNATSPDVTTPFGMLEASAQAAFTNMKYPDLIYDGVVDPSAQGPSTNRMQICFENNGDATFADLHIDRLNSMGTNLAMILTQDITPYTCSLPALPPVSFPGAN
jgi:parallel beta-helix repeat protein